MTQEEIKNNRYIYSGYSDYLDQEMNEIRPDFVDRLNEQDKEIKTLKKALELACERITELLPFHFITKEKRMNNFIQQAKENKDVKN